MKVKYLIKILERAGDELPVELDFINGDILVRGKGISCSVEPEHIFIDEDGCLQIIVPANWRPK